MSMEEKKPKKVIVVGMGNALRHTYPIAASILAQEPVTLKDCHKTDEQKEQERLEDLKVKVPEYFIEEYKLIQQKKLKLSRARRDYIVREVEKYLNQ